MRKHEKLSKCTQTIISLENMRKHNKKGRKL